MATKKTWDKSRMPSRHVTIGPNKAPQRSYYYAMGLGTKEIEQPFVGVASCWNQGGAVQHCADAAGADRLRRRKTSTWHAARILHHHGDRRHRHGA